VTEWQRSGPEPGKDYSDIVYETAEGIAKITINRHEVRNAFRPTTLFELSNAFNTARDDPSVGVIIFTGAGDKAFCSGGDQKIRGDDGYVDDHGVGRLNVLDLEVQIRRTPKPVIAMVAGYAIDGGHVLHVCCDLTIAADNAIRLRQVPPPPMTHPPRQPHPQARQPHPQARQPHPQDHKSHPQAGQPRQLHRHHQPQPHSHQPPHWPQPRAARRALGSSWVFTPPTGEADTHDHESCP
jgi:hypothetical protein